MAAMALADRYAANLHGVLSCYDRIIVTGTLPGACYAGGMTSFLYSRGIRIFDYARFAEPLRERIRERAHQVCEAAGVGRCSHWKLSRLSPHALRTPKTCGFRASMRARSDLQLIFW